MFRKFGLSIVACFILFGALSMGGCNGVLDKQAVETLHSALGQTTITVFPTFIRDGENNRYDTVSADQFVAFFNDAGLATTQRSDVEIPITSKWGMNQAKMFRGSVEDFAKYLQQNPIETEYAFLAEYLIGGKGEPLGVHFYLLDAAGKPADACLLNSHHEIFNAVNPKTADDCTTVALDALQEDLVDTPAKVTIAKKLHMDSSITVFPMRLLDKPAKDVGDVLGLALEKEQGMTDIRPATTTYDRPVEASFEDTAAGFGEFVRQNPIETDYALYAEVDGTRNPPKVLEIRSVLVARDGTVVWTDRQTPDDPDFKRLHVNEPMLCCMLVAERLQTKVDRFASYAKLEGEGRMMRLWREKSGTPDDQALADLNLQQQAFAKNHTSAKMLVYPVQLYQEIDKTAGQRLVDLLNESGFAHAELADTEARFEIAPSSNEQKRLWDFARAFRAYVQEQKPDADYVLMAEYTIRPGDQQVWTVHTFVCDRDGRWVVVDFQNNHQQDFQRVNPQSRDDCGKLVLRRLESYAR